jgi:hypothetical protein
MGKTAEPDHTLSDRNRKRVDVPQEEERKIKGSTIDDDMDNIAAIENVKGDGHADGSEVQHDVAPLANSAGDVVSSGAESLKNAADIKDCGSANDTEMKNGVGTVAE